MTEQTSTTKLRSWGEPATATTLGFNLRRQFLASCWKLHRCRQQLREELVGSYRIAASLSTIQPSAPAAKASPKNSCPSNCSPPGKAGYQSPSLSVLDLSKYNQLIVGHHALRQLAPVRSTISSAGELRCHSSSLASLLSLCSHLNAKFGKRRGLVKAIKSYNALSLRS